MCLLHQAGVLVAAGLEGAAGAGRSPSGPLPVPQVAGLVLAPSAVWISIASVLTWSIWSINEPRQPILPRKGDDQNVPLEMPLLAPGKWQGAGPPKKKA